MAGNPIKYTDRTYNSILASIDADNDLKTRPDWFKRLIAGVGDQLNRMVDMVANLSFLRTAFTRKAVADLLELIDYSLAPQETAFGTQRYNINPNATFPFTLTAAAQVALFPGSLSQASLRFEGRADFLFNPSSEAFTATPATDILAVAASYDTGDLVRVSSAGTLPAGLAAATNYWAIRVNATQIKLATTKAGAYLGNAIDITSAGTGAHTITTYAIKTTAWQQQTRSGYVVGASDGVSPFQRFDAIDDDVLKDTIEVRVNSVLWTAVETLVDSDPTDKHYRIYYKSDGTAFVKFGNGTYGAIPGAFNVEFTYRFGGGLVSNVFGVDRVNQYIGGDPEVIDTSNLEDMTGGKDPEDIETAKELGPLLLKSNNRFVTVADGVALILNLGGVTRAHINKNEFGPLSAQALVVPTGGGLPAAGLKTAVQNELISKSILESINVIADDPQYIVVSPTTTAQLAPDYTQAAVEPYYDLAWTVYFSEVTEEILAAQTVSISNAIAYVNAKYGFTFTASDNDAVKKVLDRIRLVGPRKFDETVQESTVIAFVLTAVDGVAAITVASPTFPLNSDPATKRFKTYQIGTISTTWI